MKHGVDSKPFQFITKSDSNSWLYMLAKYASFVPYNTGIYASVVNCCQSIGFAGLNDLSKPVVFR